MVETTALVEPKTVALVKSNSYSDRPSNWHLEGVAGSGASVHGDIIMYRAVVADIKDWPVAGLVGVCCVKDALHKLGRTL